MGPHRAKYLITNDRGDLSPKITAALESLAHCRQCPRQCGVNRLEGETGHCNTGRRAVLASSDAHFGEEAPLVGRSGSGTVFFSNCNLNCCFCQNEDISQGGYGVKVVAAELANAMLDLQTRGCHNINLVTPSHVTAQLLEALPRAIAKGLRLPLVYNCSGYEGIETLRLLDGVVDIYMPDFKFWDTWIASQACDAPDYPEVARQALLEMHRQVGDLTLNAKGVALSGLLVRHLVLPEGLAGSDKILAFISGKVSPDTYVNIMDQYRPCYRASRIPALNRAIHPAEFQTALEAAKDAGLRRLDPPRRVFWLD